METTTVTSSRISSLLALYDMHSTFFNSVLEGISDTDAHNRLDTKANHVAWLAGSLVQQRYEMANELDFSGNTNLMQAAHELFKDNQGIKDGVAYPSLAQYKEEWEKVTPVLRSMLMATDDDMLDSIFEMPEMKMTYFELVSFSIYREANCIGQIALWRRLLGYAPMKYM